MKMRHPPRGGPAAAGAGQGALLCLTLLRGDARTSVHVHACAGTCVCAHTVLSRTRQRQTCNSHGWCYPRKNAPVWLCPVGCRHGNSHPCPTIPSSLTAGICLCKNSPWWQLQVRGLCAAACHGARTNHPRRRAALPQDREAPGGIPAFPSLPGSLPGARGAQRMGLQAGGGGGPSAESRRNGNPLPRLPGQSPLVPQPRGGCTRRSVPTHHPEHPTSPPPCRGQHPSPNRPGPLCSLPRPAPMTDAWQSPGTTRQVFKNIN